MEEGWDLERPPRLELQSSDLEQLVEPAFPGGRLTEWAPIPAGLANTNLWFRLEGRAEKFVLRLHTRDAQAAARERALMHHFASHPASRPPVPALLYSDPAPQRGQHPYSIWSFVEGTLLRELFHTQPAAELVEMAGACGRELARLALHPFPRCGELGAALEITREYGAPSEFVPGGIHQMLFEQHAGEPPRAAERLGRALRDELWRAVERTAPRLRAIDDRYTLVHADYKRSNLLMQRRGAEWHVAAVLDWEFAFAGPPLVDVGLFLRAGERLPPGFRDAFASAYTAAGGQLPPDWLPLSRLVDVLSQLTFLSDPRERPRVFAESIEVVKETLHLLS